MSLLLRLLVLVAVALLPAIGIQAYNEFELRRTRQIEVQNQALNLAELAAAEQRQIIQGIHQALIALSEFPAVKARDADTCNAYLARIKRRYPGFISFIMVDESGLSFCNATVYSKPSTAAGRPYLTEVLKSRRFTVGEFALGRQSGRNVLHFALPFFGDDGRLGGVVIAALSLDWLAESLARRNVPLGAALAIVDRNGTFLARYPDNARFVGRRMPDVDGSSPGDRTTADIVDLDGVERIVGYSSLKDDSGGLLISFGLDKALAFTEIQRGTLRGIFQIVLSTALVLLLTSLGARRFIRRPLGQLVDAANQWQFGKFDQRVDIRETSEIAGVADAFNTMADALEHREHELSEAKEKAEEAAARITMIFESTTDSVIIVDQDWRISYLNGPARLRLAPEGEIGTHFLAACPATAEMDIVKQIREATSEQRPAFLEVLCQRTQVWYTVSAFPSSQGLAIFLRDITEHKHALEARRLMEEQLHQSQKMESVGQLTGGVAHDFNNLLTVISANLELIAGAADTCKVPQYIEAAQRAADRGAKLTTQLLAFSRRQALRPKLVNANDLICGFQVLIRQAVGDGCEVELRTDEALWLCHVDPALLETALLNLALNARDAMADRGVLQIETRNITEDKCVAGRSPGPYVRLSVADNGGGMPSEVRDRVFEPFFTTKEVGKGTGLGLSMVYGFVRQSGGHITIDSILGAGTMITLYLPAITHTPDVEPIAAEVHDLPMGSERILVVDDNDDLLNVTSAMLSSFGYQVCCAHNGAEALRTLQGDRPFELLFSDIVMPNGMNGIELAREAKRLRQDIKVLLTSGYADGALQRNHAVGEFAIIDKPYALADLARQVRSILRGA